LISTTIDIASFSQTKQTWKPHIHYKNGFPNYELFIVIDNNFYKHIFSQNVLYFSLPPFFPLRDKTKVVIDSKSFYKSYCVLNNFSTINKCLYKNKTKNVIK